MASILLLIYLLIFFLVNVSCGCRRKNLPFYQRCPMNADDFALNLYLFLMFKIKYKYVKKNKNS